MREVARRVFDEALFQDCNVVLFEDGATGVELFPMAVLRPSWEIRCGAGSTRRWLSHLLPPGRPPILRPREGMKAMSAGLSGNAEEAFDPDRDTVFLNGRIVGLWRNGDNTPTLPETLTDLQGRVLLARRSGSQAEHLLDLSGNEMADSLVQQGGIPYSQDVGWTLAYAKFVWDYMINNPTILNQQFTAGPRGAADLMGAHVLRELPAGVHLTDRMTGYPVYVGSSVKLMAGAVLGNHAGPIWIGSETEIEPQAYVEGPIYVGERCRVKAGARLYRGSAIGDQCRVAGEISQSVFQGYANKQHDGFIGNSILGQWVNLGADTRTSNLRNDYGEVKVKVGSRLVRTGERYIGLLAGDHVKTGINTMFNTATVVGIAANVYGAGYPPHYIGSFQMGGKDGLKPAILERTLETAKLVMSRRTCELSAAEEDLLRKHYAETVNEEMQK